MSHDSYSSLPEEAVVHQFAEHERWIASDGKEGEPARFEHADLSGRDFSDKNLRGVIMHRCRLQGTKFDQAILDDADLSGSDLSGADLSGAVFSGANLADTLSINQAILNEADLSGARGLLCGHFSGADLTGAKLPDTIACFDKLRFIAEVEQIARPIYLFLLVLALFSFLTVVSTTDAALVANAPSAMLPNLPTQIPAASLFQVGPLLLIFLFIYLHLYLLGVWEALSELPAKFPDGTPLEKKANPWLVNSLIGLKNRGPLKKQPAVILIREFVVIILIWGLVPLVLLLYWWRYLARHDLAGSVVQILLFLGTTWVAVTLFRIAVAALTENSLNIDVARAKHLAFGLLMTGLVMGALSFGIIRHPLKMVFWGAKQDPEHATLFVADVDGAEFSTKQNNWNGNNIAGVKGAGLRSADMRDAFGQYAFLVNADLRKAVLTGADIYQGDFRGANLEKASLDGANLDMANFSESCLRKADLREADLEDAIFDNAYLGKANLGESQLMHTTFINTFLQGTNFVGADLESADLTGAVLTCFQKKDRVDERKCTSLQGAKMKATDFSHADLSFASLAQVTAPAARFLHARLAATDFRGANLSDADLQGASAGCLNRITGQRAAPGENSRCTDFTDARLPGANLSGADLVDALGLTATSLQAACGDEHTRLPDGLQITHCAAGRRTGHLHRPVTPPLAKGESHNPCWQNIFQDQWPKPDRSRIHWADH